MMIKKGDCYDKSVIGFGFVLLGICSWRERMGQSVDERRATRTGLWSKTAVSCFLLGWEGYRFGSVGFGWAFAATCLFFPGSFSDLPTDGKNFFPAKA